MSDTLTRISATIHVYVNLNLFGDECFNKESFAHDFARELFPLYRKALVSILAERGSAMSEDETELNASVYDGPSKTWASASVYTQDAQVLALVLPELDIDSEFEKFRKNWNELKTLLDIPIFGAPVHEKKSRRIGNIVVSADGLSSYFLDEAGLVSKEIHRGIEGVCQIEHPVNNRPVPPKYVEWSPEQLARLHSIIGSDSAA